jgi:hypothetical protein
MVFKDGAFGKLLGLDEITRIESPQLNPGDFVKRGRETHTYT